MATKNPFQITIKNDTLPASPDLISQTYQAGLLPHKLYWVLLKHAEAGTLTVEFLRNLASLPLMDQYTQGAYSENTFKAIGGDFAKFTDWCLYNNRTSFPADPGTVAAFIDASSTRYKPASVRRYLASVSMVHQKACQLVEGFEDIDNPTRHEKVRMAVKRMNRKKGVRQKQAGALNRSHIEKMIMEDTGSLRDARDIAMLSVAYDTLARRSELVALHVEDVTFQEDGSGIALIRNAKNDQEGQGQSRYLAPDTVRSLRRWLDEARIHDGPLFVGVDNADHLVYTGIKEGEKRSQGLSAQGFYRAVKRFSKRAGLDPNLFSGHSARVGAAQDMVASRLSLAGVMQAGGWKSPGMVARYTEEIAASQGSAADLAKIQGRK